MTAITSALPVAQSMATLKPVTPATAVEVSAATTVLASPTTTVTLAGETNEVNLPLYNQQGSLGPVRGVPVWEYTQQDKVTLAMTGGFSTTSTASRFQGLGAALLEQLSQSGTNISQSVVRASAGSTLEPAQVSAAQTKIHSAADNTISLTIQTASGKTVQLTLSSSDNGLAVQAQVSGGELNDEELAALGKMADGFQSAIDGLTASPPKLNLDSLTQLDSSVFKSMNLSTSLKLDDGSLQTLSASVDSEQRTVSMSGPSGDLHLSVDLKNAAVLGDSNQQAQALKSYLSQIEAARKRGDGDQTLLTMFEDAFKALHSNYPDTRQGISAQTASAVKLNDTDHALLTGLADFTASVKEKTTAPNPSRPDELDAFAYQLSQTTQTKGGDSLNRSVEQDQQSNLIASYHRPLYAGQKLGLTTEKDSQNYQYHEVSDQASSKASIGYEQGKLSWASLTQSASQSTRISRYVMGHLESQATTPLSSSKTQNLLGLLQQAVQQDREASQGRGVSTLKQTLAALHDKVLLQADPARLKG